MAEHGPTIQIPRWIQLVGLPVLAVLAWAVAGTLGHALFLLLTAAVIAFLLNTLVRDLERIEVRAQATEWLDSIEANDVSKYREFFAERVSLEPWSGAGPVPVEVELEPPVSRADDPLKAASS